MNGKSHWVKLAGSKHHLRDLMLSRIVICLARCSLQYPRKHVKTGSVGLCLVIQRRPPIRREGEAPQAPIGEGNLTPPCGLTRLLGGSLCCDWKQQGEVGGQQRETRCPVAC
ncbi:hypothetical protein B0I35DRAFT_169275 [Stachybotrys elegans]|uniref:Uncharacterized protein n=1 Tax=Stachybotrys elegans TaxID=80388 RepID=A0A8K0WUI4_9HYPO|nr:hypothetical protein B0I35DRAFT_169275 [Stachybotrys elegans]